MPKYINADEMLSDESEAYIRAQTKISDIETYALNYLVHAKIQRLLHDAPAADVAPVVHGRWVDAGRGIKACSNCNHGIKEHMACANHYCPNCGTKMDEGDEGEG